APRPALATRHRYRRRSAINLAPRPPLALLARPFGGHRGMTDGLRIRRRAAVAAGEGWPDDIPPLLRRLYAARGISDPSLARPAGGPSGARRGRRRARPRGRSAPARRPAGPAGAARRRAPAAGARGPGAAARWPPPARRGPSRGLGVSCPGAPPHNWNPGL